MINTCTIDNHLYGIHVLLSKREDLLQEFQESEDNILKLLVQIHKEFTKKNFSHGKYLWVSQFQKFDFQQMSLVNLFGSEYDFFFSKLDCCITECTSICSNNECHKKSKTLCSKMLCLSTILDSTATNFQNALNDWLNSEKVKPCTGLSKRKKCTGMRTISQRAFVSRHLSHCRTGSDKLCVDNPKHNKSEKLYYSWQYTTYGNGGHSISIHKSQGQKNYLYDGLKEYNCVGNRLIPSKKKTIPAGFIKSYAVCARNRDMPL